MYFVLWWLVSSVIWVNLFLALILEVSAEAPSCPWGLALLALAAGSPLECPRPLMCGGTRPPGGLGAAIRRLAPAGAGGLAGPWIPASG